MGKPGEIGLPENACGADSSLAGQLLGWRARAVGETVVELGKGLLELERSSKTKAWRGIASWMGQDKSRIV